MAVLDDVLRRMESMQRDLRDLPIRLAVTGAQVNVNSLSEVSEDLGLITRGEFRTYGNGLLPGSGYSGVRMASPGALYEDKYWDLALIEDDKLLWGLSREGGIEMRLGNGLPLGDGFAGLRLAYPPIVHNGDSYSLLTYDSDGVMCLGIGVDGKLYAGGGSAIIDENGIQLFGISSFINFDATHDTDSVHAEIKVAIPSTGGAPALTLNSYSTSSLSWGSELLADPDLSISSDWTFTTSTGMIFSRAFTFGGPYAPVQFTIAPFSSDVGVADFASAPVIVTAGKSYLCSVEFLSFGIDSGSVSLLVDWYGSTGGLISTSTIGLRDISGAFTLIGVGSAPTGAAGAIFKVRTTTAAYSAADVQMNSVSMKEGSASLLEYMLQFSPNATIWGGFTIHGGATMYGGLALEGSTYAGGTIDNVITLKKHTAMAPPSVFPADSDHVTLWVTSTGGIQLNPTTDITGADIKSVVFGSDLTPYLLSSDLPAYTAGSRLALSTGKVFSVVSSDVDYTAGSGIAISTGRVISVSSDVDYVAGAGVVISTGRVISVSSDVIMSSDVVYPNNADVTAMFVGVGGGTATSRIFDINQMLGFYQGRSAANAANGDVLTFPVFLAARTGLSIAVFGVTSSDSGIFDAYLDDVLIGSGYDCYSAATAYNQTLASITSVTFAYNGNHIIKLVTNGKNAASADYRILTTLIRVLD